MTTSLIQLFSVTGDVDEELAAAEAAHAASVPSSTMDHWAGLAAAAADDDGGDEWDLSDDERRAVGENKDSSLKRMTSAEKEAFERARAAHYAEEARKMRELLKSGALDDDDDDDDDKDGSR